jgi:acyl transferase domain-containing protein/NADPH:quinone reductase-like Zn-dependent oxidoreductase
MVYVVSSKDAAGAAAMNKQLSQYIEDASSHGKTVSPADLAYTLNERKSRFPWLTACRARKLQDLATKLNGPSKPTRAMPKPPRIGYVFNGQGAQWYRMGRELTDAYPVFDEALTKADQTLRTTYGAQWSLKEELLRDERTTKVHDVALAQPICVALQLCLVDLLQSWNIVPAAVASHSSGEIAAAYCAGCLSFQEALGVAYFRGSLAAKHLKLASTHVSTQVPGAMLAAGLSADEAQAYVNRARGKVVIACVNSPSSVTLSGDLPVIDEIAAALEDDDVFQRKLKVPMAYHSHHMESMAPEYGQILNEILPEKGLPPRVTFASPVTGELVDYGAAFGPQHWVRNLVNPVLFSEALKSMVFGTTKTSEVQAPQVDVLIEIGPHDMLAGPVRQTLGDKQLPYLSCLKRPANAVDSMQDLACELLMRGSPVSLREVNQTSAHAAKYIHDLPSYVWNHASSYHFESRLSREHRVRRFVPHELLGTPVPGANEHTPTWRNMLRVQDIDWLVDHQLESQVVLPGAGYITMAIEAVKLLKGQASTSGYRLRDVDIANALIIPAATGIETIFSLRPCSETQLDHRDWYDFELWSVGTDFRWTQHCSGSVAVDVSHPREQPEDIFSATADVTDVVEVDPEQIYVAMRGMNFWHGPAFQNLTRSRLLGSKSIADFRLSEAAAAGDYVLHPSTLDSVFQSCYGCFGPDAKEDAVFLPRRIGGLYVPVHFARQKPGRPELQTLIELSKLGKREAIFQAEIRAFDSDEEDGRSNRLRMQDLQLQRIQQEGDGQDLKRICAKVRWEADVLHDIPASMKETMKVWLTKSELDFQRRLRESSYHLLRAAWLQLRHESSEDWEEHHRKFFVWMEAVIREADSGELEPGSEKWQTVGDPQELYNSVFAEHVAGELLCKIGSRLVDIFRKTIMPLELMMEDGLLHRYYEEVPEKGRLRCLRNQFRQIMDLYITKEPGAKVLEIGGGTGSATIHALEALTGRSKLADGSGSGSLLGRFDFTDISAGFFDKAKTKFAAFESVMTYSRLDIETDPLQQGFTTASYDLIITAEVLHATKNLQRTLTHVRSLLKPGGKFVLVESTRGSLDSQLIFGVLPGWWLSEESERAEGPLIPASSWDRHLRATGFSGIEFEISDCEDGEVNFSTLMVTTAVAQPSFPSTVSIVVDSTTDYESKWLQELMGQLKPLAGEVLVENFHSVQSQSDRVYILALDIDTHVMESMQEETFEKLRKILINSHSIIWLSQGGLAAGESFTTSQAQGLLRTLRREDGSKRCVQIDFDAVSWADGVKATQHIIHVFRQTMDQNSANDVVDWEYAVKDSVLHVPRLYPDAEQDRACCPSAKPIPEPALFHETGRDVVWKASDDGLLDKAHFVERNALADEELPEGMVEVEPQAFGLNFRDVLIAMGMLTPDQDGMVHEAAGIVTRLGENTSSSGLKVGDRVCGVFSGFFASTSRTPWTSVVQIPDSMSWEEAVSIPYAFVTAHYGLITLARLKRTDRILIHSAAGGVGQAAIMIAQHIGAEIFVTCGTEDKRALLMEQYGLPSDHIFTSRDVSFALPLMAKTKGKGVDVVLNSLAGPLLKATWECMARFGRFIEIGKMDIEARRTLDMSPFGRGVMFAAVDLSQTRVYDPMTVHEALVASVELCRSGRARAVHPITAFPISDMRKAMQYMQRGQHKGKLVIVPRPGDQVPTIRRQPPLPLNDCNSTYLVVGGMTGVGQAITSWMIDQKTKNLVVVSRNATTHPLCLATREHARKNKCNLQVRDCDIADEQSFLALLNEIKATMPPIKGIIHAGMVLDVRSTPSSSSQPAKLTQTPGHRPRTHGLHPMANRHPPQSRRNTTPPPPHPRPQILHHALLHRRRRRRRFPKQLLRWGNLPRRPRPLPHRTRATRYHNRPRTSRRCGVRPRSRGRSHGATEDYPRNGECSHPSFASHDRAGNPRTPPPYPRRQPDRNLHAQLPSPARRHDHQKRQAFRHLTPRRSIQRQRRPGGLWIFRPGRRTAPLIRGYRPDESERGGGRVAEGEDRGAVQFGRGGGGCGTGAGGVWG